MMIEISPSKLTWSCRFLNVHKIFHLPFEINTSQPFDFLATGRLFCDASSCTQRFFSLALPPLELFSSSV